MKENQENKNRNQTRNKTNRGHGQGWREAKNPITEVAQRHSDVQKRRVFNREGFNGILVTPKHEETDENVTLHFDISEKDFTNFVEISKKFSEENDTDIKVEADEGKTIVEMPKCYVWDFVASLEKNEGIELDKNEIEEIKEKIGDKEQWINDSKL
jgi:hypothetical protein